MVSLPKSSGFPVRGKQRSRHGSEEASHLALRSASELNEHCLYSSTGYFCARICSSAWLEAVKSERSWDCFSFPSRHGIFSSLLVPVQIPLIADVEPSAFKECSLQKVRISLSVRGMCKNSIKHIYIQISSF